MLDNNISLTNILVGLESVLKIEYLNGAKVEETIQKAIDTLESTYSVTFSTDLFSLQQEHQLTSSKLEILIRDITQSLSQMGLFIQLKSYHCNLGITLADVNYLGYAKPRLLTCLTYLQDKKAAAATRDEIIPPLTATLNNIGMSTIKRLFVCMLVLDRLGVAEGVAVVSQVLYMGGLVE